jgi:hypothetical protein
MLRRVRRLERHRLPADQCPGPITAVLYPGGSRPEVAMHRCELCGEPHVLVIEEVIVSSREEVETTHES